MKSLKSTVGKRLFIKNIKSLTSMQEYQNRQMLADGRYQETLGYAVRELAMKRCVFINNLYVVIFGFDSDYSISD
tara:strand:+ start:26084 stop:26308 length:225 start_codon:yes stop_codon:yes gene_type:complete